MCLEPKDSRSDSSVVRCRRRASTTMLRRENEVRLDQSWTFAPDDVENSSVDNSIEQWIRSGGTVKPRSVEKWWKTERRR